MGYSVAKLINQALKNGAANNMAVDGSAVSKVFSYSPPAGFDVEISTVCLLCETSNAMTFGNKFIDTTIATLANGLLLEVKAADVAFTWQNCKRTRDLVELTEGGDFEIVTATPNFFRAELWLPEKLKLSKQGTWLTDDYLKATVRDNLTAITFMEIFFQGVKL